MVARVPQIRDTLHLKPSALGALLLMVAVGSVISLPLAGTIVHRLGPARAVRIMSLLAVRGHDGLRNAKAGGLALMTSVFIAGYTLTELMLVVAIVGSISSIGITVRGGSLAA